MATETITSEIDLEQTSTPKGVEGDAQDQDTSQVEIKIVDDTPEADRNRPPRKPGTRSAVPEDDEIEKYSKETADRFRQMKWEFHEERRAKEQSQREHLAAVDFAKKVHAENNKLRELLTKGHKTLLESQQSAGENEIKALQRSLKTAMETGDTEAAADLSAKIAAASARVEAVKHTQPLVLDDADPDRFIQDGPSRQTRQQDQQDQRRLPQRPQVTQRMQEWMDENPWFNQDKRMTAYVFGIHEELIAQRVPPESPKYFAEIDREMRERFPEYWDTGGRDSRDRGDRGDRGTRDRRDTQARRVAATGVTRAPAGRAGGKQRVELTASQVAFAKKLGVTPEQYAAEMIRLQESDNV